MKKVKHNNIPIFIPELACPHQCVFCNQEKISGAESVPQPNEVRGIVESYLETIPENRTVDIAFFGGSFTGIPVELQKAYLDEASYFLKQGRITGVRMSTRPDYIDEEILEMLKSYGVSTIELGAQSTDDFVLKKSGRGHTFADLERASKLIKESGIELGLQMMIGLPHDTFEKTIQTANDIVRLGATNTRIYPCIVVKGTALERQFLRGRYEPLSLKEAIERAVELYKIFDAAGVNILRMGLHPSEELVEGKSLVAGPMHQSFKEMVLSKMWSQIIDQEIDKETPKEQVLRVHSSQINYAIGYRSQNRLRLENEGLVIKFLADNELDKFQLNVSNN